MKKKICLLLILFFSLFFPFPTFAQNSNVYIEDFQSDVTVNKDGTIDVTEEILYVFNESRHGMYRNIPISYKLDNGETQYLDIDVNSVSYKPVSIDTTYSQYTTQRDSKYLAIKIGDPNTYIQGKYLYTISYTINYLIENYNNMDKLYFSIIGDEWEEPIRNASAIVTMPDTIQDSHCYTGPKGSTESVCNIITQSDNKIVVNTPLQFNGKTFFTVTATVKPGTIQDLTIEKTEFNENFKSSVTGLDNFPVIWRAVTIGSVLFIVISIIVTFLLVIKRTKGPKYIAEYLPNTIPQYNVPPGWYVTKMDILLNKMTKNRTLTAQIIQLCVYGYLKLEKDKDKITLYKTDKSITDLVEPLQLFYNGLMGDKDSLEIPNKTSYKKLYDEEYLLYTQIFYHNFKIAQMKIYNELKAQGYYKKEEKNKKSHTNFFVAILIILIIFGGFIGGMLINNPTISIIAFASIFVAIFANVIISSIKSTKRNKVKYTKDGEELVRYIHGLHMYIDTAEKERIAFHNDPEKYKGVFETLLPYAILFGLEEKWVKLFNINSLQFSWFNNVSGSGFDIGGITSSISSFTHFTNSQITRSSSTGGSSHSSGSSGGSSGGGGGGGGGGSW
jgi:uncharacterized membrane protein YgcG